VGIGVGAAAQIVPLYLSEIAPKEIRGRLVAMNTTMITLGQISSVIFVLLFIPSWRWMLGLAAIPSIIQFFAVLFMPESPRWLVKEGRIDEGREVMKTIF
jgi:SP family myo-inositol transporter-like MFS transporter 13